MLTELRIRNFAIIEQVTLPLDEGFNVLSGETGAGTFGNDAQCCVGMYQSLCHFIYGSIAAYGEYARESLCHCFLCQFCRMPLM